MYDVFVTYPSGSCDQSICSTLNFLWVFCLTLNMLSRVWLHTALKQTECLLHWSWKEKTYWSTSKFYSKSSPRLGTLGVWRANGACPYNYKNGIVTIWRAYFVKMCSVLKLRDIVVHINERLFSSRRTFAKFAEHDFYNLSHNVFLI